MSAHNMSPLDFLTDSDIAEYLRLKVSTVKKNRSIGINHPPFIKIGGRILYPKKEFEHWIKSLELQREISYRK